MYRNLLGIAIG